MPRPTVLLDCDGVIADFTSNALSIVNELTGKNYKPQDVTTWEIFDSIPEKAVQKEVYRRIKQRGGCGGIPVYAGAQDALARIHELADIVIVTSPFRGSETWVHEREDWLDTHFGKYIQYAVHTKNKERVHGDIFVDDKASHVTAWAEYWVASGRHPRAQAFLWKGNVSIAEIVARGITCTGNWDDVFGAVQALV